MLEYIFVAMIYTLEGNSTAVTQRVSTLKECDNIGLAFKAMEENMDYTCIKVKALR